MVWTSSETDHNTPDSWQQPCSRTSGTEICSILIALGDQQRLFDNGNAIYTPATKAATMQMLCRRS
jgi:hypothetical protein